MFKARREEEWMRTAHLLAQQANLHRDPKDSAFSVADFNPLMPRKRKKEKDLSMLKAVFVDRKFDKAGGH